jgi:hypothetical protein
MVSDKESEIRKVTDQLRRKDGEVESHARKAQDLEYELREAHNSLRDVQSQPGSYKSIGGPGFGRGETYEQQQAYSAYKNQSTGGITSEEEKNHIIKVLEHESKVYRFEKNLVSMVGDFDVYSEQGRSPAPRNNRSYDI